MTLSDFLEKKGRGSQAQMARDLKCSKGYLSEIVNGEKYPSRAFALKIEAYTRRKVKAASLLGLKAA